ncbi:MAG: hypothetical protein ACFFG0_00955 [Candidatus Thorarchaeota archaeon]
MKRIKLIFGLFGCSFDGILYTPNGKRIIKLHKNISFKIQSFLNKYVSYVGLENEFLLF